MTLCRHQKSNSDSIDADACLASCPTIATSRTLELEVPCKVADTIESVQLAWKGAPKLAGSVLPIGHCLDDLWWNKTACYRNATREGGVWRVAFDGHVEVVPQEFQHYMWVVNGKGEHASPSLVHAQQMGRAGFVKGLGTTACPHVVASRTGKWGFRYLPEPTAAHDTVRDVYQCYAEGSCASGSPAAAMFTLSTPCLDNVGEVMLAWQPLRHSEDNLCLWNTTAGRVKWWEPACWHPATRNADGTWSLLFADSDKAPPVPPNGANYFWIVDGDKEGKTQAEGSGILTAFLDGRTGAGTACPYVETDNVGAGGDVASGREHEWGNRFFPFAQIANGNYAQMHDTYKCFSATQCANFPTTTTTTMTTQTSTTTTATTQTTSASDTPLATARSKATSTWLSPNHTRPVPTGPTTAAAPAADASSAPGSGDDDDGLDDDKAVVIVIAIVLVCALLAKTMLFVAVHRKRAKDLQACREAVPLQRARSSSIFDFETKFKVLQSLGLISARADKVVPTELDRTAIAMTKMIGKGNFGEVWQGTLTTVDVNKAEGTAAVVYQDVAIKKTTDPEGEAEMVSESLLLASVGEHPNVVQCLGCVSISKPSLLVMSLCRHGALKAFLEARATTDNTLGVARKVGFALDVATGMRHLIGLGILHRDLAARNVLVCGSTEAEDDLVCRIADFGLSRTAKSAPSVTAEDEGMYYRSSGGLFPARWTAPEAMATGRYSEATDVWSFGIVAIEIFQDGREPYPGMGTNEVVNAVLQGMRSPQPKGCPHRLYNDVVLPCWLASAAARPTFARLAAQLAVPVNDFGPDAAGGAGALRPGSPVMNIFGGYSNMAMQERSALGPATVPRDVGSTYFQLVSDTARGSKSTGDSGDRFAANAGASRPPAQKRFPAPPPLKLDRLPAGQTLSSSSSSSSLKALVNENTYVPTDNVTPLFSPAEAFSESPMVGTPKRLEGLVGGVGGGPAPTHFGSRVVGPTTGPDTLTALRKRSSLGSNIVARGSRIVTSPRMGANPGAVPGSPLRAGAPNRPESGAQVHRSLDLVVAAQSSPHMYVSQLTSNRSAVAVGSLQQLANGDEQEQEGMGTGTGARDAVQQATGCDEQRFGAVRRGTADSIVAFPGTSPGQPRSSLGQYVRRMPTDFGQQRQAQSSPWEFNRRTAELLARSTTPASDSGMVARTTPFHDGGVLRSDTNFEDYVDFGEHQPALNQTTFNMHGRLSIMTPPLYNQPSFDHLASEEPPVRIATSGPAPAVELRRPSIESSVV